MSLFKKSLAVFSSNWIYNILHFITGVYVVRTFGADGKGFVALFLAGTGFISSMMVLGQTNASVYFAKKSQISIKELVRRILLLCIVSVILIGALLLIFREVIWNLLFDGVVLDGFSLFLVLAYFPVLIILLLIKAYYLGLHNLKEYRNVMMLTSFGGLILTILLTEYVIKSIYTPIVAVLLIELVVAIIYLVKLYKQTEDPLPEIVGWRKFFSFGLKSHISTVGNALFSRIDYFVIAAFIDLETLGYYSVAKFFYQALMSVPLSINGLLLGTFSGFDQKDSRKSKALNKKVFNYMLIIMTGLVVAGLLLGPYFIPLIYGSEFSVSIKPYNVLLIAAVFMGSSSTFQAFFTGIGKPEVTGKIGVFGGTVKIIFTLLLVSDYSIYGVALATLASAIIIFILRLYFFKNTLVYAK
ncbi:MAG: O-antigen/teichoic acid export membrane protein [Roseivirga sp.]|jgi:O-antigen/teichoic acid export membrane protein